MTRLFVLLPFIALALASIGSRSDPMESSLGGMESSSSLSDSSERQEFEIKIGPVYIKVIGSFSGLGKWDWQGAKPGDNATIHQVTVGDMKDGKPQLAYNPPSVNALPGDYVQFNFKAQNHTVTQSTLEKPCVKMPDGMDSGFMPNPNNTMPIPPSMIVEVNDTQPLWFYCRQATHCGKGMAFGINPGGPEKMAEFMTNAKAQNGTAADGPANASAASSSASAGNSTSGDLNGLGPSSAIASPTGTPLSDLVPGEGQDSTSGDALASEAGADSADEETCNCNCLCDLGQPGMGGLVGSIPLPDVGALGKRSGRF